MLGGTAVTVFLSSRPPRETNGWAPFVLQHHTVHVQVTHFTLYGLMVSTRPPLACLTTGQRVRRVLGIPCAA